MWTITTTEIQDHVIPTLILILYISCLHELVNSWKCYQCKRKIMKALILVNNQCKN